MMIHKIEDKDMEKSFVNFYIKIHGTDCLVIVPGGAECHIIKKDLCYRNLGIEPKVSLCVKNGYGNCVAISLHDSEAEAEAARLQFIHDYCKEEEEFEL